jgi:cell fate regulator YaaT (PSP1 superfamily)
MGRDPEQLADWLTGRRRPCKRNIHEIEKFLLNVATEQQKLFRPNGIKT